MRFQKIPKNELRLQSVPSAVSNDLKNISGNIGISLTALLKKHLREIIDQYPDEMKLPPAIEETKEIRIRGLSPKMVEQFYNISANSGAELVSLLNIKLKEITNSYPENKKRKLNY